MIVRFFKHKSERHSLPRKLLTFYFEAISYLFLKWLKLTLFYHDSFCINKVFVNQNAFKNIIFLNMKLQMYAFIQKLKFKNH